MTGLLLRLAKQWIAGEDAQSGINRVRRANSKGVLGLLNLLGEHVILREQIDATVTEYIRLLDLIDSNGVKSHISVKPTQLGVSLDFEYCVENYLKIASACDAHSKNYLWIDMENSPYTQKTIDLYIRVLSKYPNTGLAIQSYLKRSESDLRTILPLGAKIRLVKGAYNESSDISFKQKKLVTENYSKLLGVLFDQKESNFFAVATHDSSMIERAKELSKGASADFEFEMLMGVRDNLKMDLVKEGHQVREYIPYGPEWLAYSIRRIKEKKSNILLLGRSIFSQ